MGWPQPPSTLSEDCLYLNVYAPAKNSSKAPVMFWLFGGSFTGGGGNETRLVGSVSEDGLGQVGKQSCTTDCTDADVRSWAASQFNFGQDEIDQLIDAYTDEVSIGNYSRWYWLMQHAGLEILNYTGKMFNAKASLRNKQCDFWDRYFEKTVTLLKAKAVFV